MQSSPPARRGGGSGRRGRCRRHRPWRGRCRRRPTGHRPCRRRGGPSRRGTPDARPGPPRRRRRSPAM
ncbi:unnamed protein product [Spirodela intermedia]|uniref:Uncharacterized protein n=1 Tax=Spirodela intermedia TaxID=51605 RepID=A0ABN7EB99_SPIIN|nr:unnamed protein product [Spirodela intermedia]